MTDVDQFVTDMAEVIDLAKATEKQRDVGRAWLRYAISHARAEAAKRKNAAPTHAVIGETR